MYKRQDVYVSSHPHLKATTGTRGLVLSRRFVLGLGWRGEVVEGRLEGEANPHEGEATSSSRNNCLVAGGAVSVISTQRPRLMYRNCYRPATRSLRTLSLSSQLVSDEERRSWRFRPERISYGSDAERHGCIHVARSVPHERKLTYTGSGSASLWTS